MSRKPQTCAECSRGSAQWCRLANVAHAVERQASHPSAYPPPGGSEAIGDSMDSTLNERLLGLVTRLSNRVEHLEARMDTIGPEKRPLPQDDEVDCLEEDVSPSLSTRRRSKQPRISQNEMCRVLTNTEDSERQKETGIKPSLPELDAEVEDAATVLEFLAWGRLKDSNITTGLRDTSGDSALGSEKDTIQTTQTWGLSPTSVSGSQSIDTLQISQIQDLLPSKAQAFLLVEYHAEWLLFMHCSFHAQTLRRDLEKFYLNDQGNINMTSSGLQWTALLFAVICGSMTCAKPAQIGDWGFVEGNQSSLAKQWYQASVECLSAAKYQQNHSRSIRRSDDCEFHYLRSLTRVRPRVIMETHADRSRFSNSQSVLLAAAVRIAQSLGLHRLGKPKSSTRENANYDPAERVQQEIGRRVWQQLTIQDWFSVPFSETYCVNPLHFSTNAPLHCDEETMRPTPLSSPTIMSYGNFLFRVACLMPALLDQSSRTHTLEAKYDEVLRFDQMMRELVVSELPPCLNSQTPIEPQWPRWVLLARRCLTVTSAHKIIMIHRSFLGMSFHDKRYAFTRRTCLSAAKTIINEVKQDLPDESPIIWTTQAFSVAAAIILSLDNFSRHQSAQEYIDNRQLVLDVIKFLSGSISISSIASRGTRLLVGLLAEEEKHTQIPDTRQNLRGESQRAHGEIAVSKSGDKSLNISAFVKKFCQQDQAPPGSSPIADSHMPLWLQQETSTQSYSNARRESQEMYTASRDRSCAASNSRMPPPPSMNDAFDPTAGRRQHEYPPNPFTQAFSDNFDIRNVNWFDDLLGLAPSHSI
ncbi:putative transcription factor lepB [Lachnellula arida]|uniref:Putative transcription factor lepB n=1 Tax=Lachnellula arida TaxID=1316785 RepID=A0A8T9BL87_9HELO|nr:putative transcription factor lepB [Lachnellula arida]